MDSRIRCSPIKLFEGMCKRSFQAASSRSVQFAALVINRHGSGFVPKGSHVLLSRIGLGRNPETWEEPLKYNPERHLGGNVSKVDLSEPNLRFLTFSTGKRACTGQIIGTLLTIMALGNLIQRFTWSLPPNEEKIDLSTSEELTLAKPLQAYARPRLDEVLYQL
ncbi:phenylalanine N-monooxygenase-like [Olea europaea subsp. europaea]|uniref:Phenylalanine N-monooxygenase-like n=1 Tax=Olea europaea subsp. europaea TaxID=158383 RepID=A0A8S0SAM2_OLEEU|nr:phenylalanine N-monooxygenase-like [Olea europaea subsp. europaea]